MTLPAYGDGKADNIVAGGQTITIPSTYANTGNAIEFLAFATGGTITGASGTITYASACGGKKTTQNYVLSTVPDWVSGWPASAAATTFPGQNELGEADNDATPTRVYAISVPLGCDNVPVSSIQLPAISDGVQPGSSALHILAVGVRPSSYTDTTYSQNWTATFAAKEDSKDGSLAQTTVRMPAVVSVGGTSLRIHLSNALGTAPVTFNDVTVAQQSSGAQPVAATMKNVTFGGNASITIPGRRGRHLRLREPYHHPGRDPARLRLHQRRDRRPGRPRQRHGDHVDDLQYYQRGHRYHRDPVHRHQRRVHVLAHRHRCHLVP